MEKHEYIYPVEELDKIIEQLDRGITPMMTDAMQLEVKLRYQELQNEIFEEEDVDESSVDMKKHSELMKKHLEKKKREATKHDIVVIKLSEKQQKQLEEDMRTSLVRQDPNDPYNTPDDQLCESKDKAIIMRRLSGLKNCYYNQTDYRNAVNIILDAIRYSLKNDYPWMSEQQAMEAFNKGEIKFTYCKMPKLYINATKQITDPTILRGVFTGDVKLVDRSESEPVKAKHKRNEEKNVTIPYNVISTEAYKNMVELHAMGYDTPLSVAFKSKASVYNRFALPAGNRFSIVSSNTADQNANSTRDEMLQSFDWSREGAGEEYFRLKYNQKYSISDLVDDLQKSNDNHINNIIGSNMNEFMRSLNNGDGQKHYETISNSLEKNPNAIQIEQGILNAIRMSNPNR